MKKLKFIVPLLAVGSLLGGGLLFSCNENKPIEPDDNLPTSVHYYVNFYVDGELYQTARVKEGETVGNVVKNPTKDGYDFKGWKASDGQDYDLNTTVVNSDLTINAVFEKKEEVKPEPGDKEYNVLDTKEEGKDYFIVIGWYGKTGTSRIDETVMKMIYKNLDAYFSYMKYTDDQLSKVSVRKYGDADTNIAAFTDLVAADGDVDIVMGVGATFNSTDTLTVKEKITGLTIGDDSKRVTARIGTVNEAADKLFEYLETDNGKTIYQEGYVFDSKALEPVTPDPEPSEKEYNVLDTKEEGKDYFIVIGWYGKTGTSRIDETVMKMIYKNLDAYFSYMKYTDDQLSKVSVRKYGDADTNIAAFTDLVAADGDVDIVMGVGATFNSTDTLTVKEKITGLTIGDDSKRVTARIGTVNEAADKLFEYLKTDNGKTIYQEGFVFDSTVVIK